MTQITLLDRRAAGVAAPAEVKPTMKANDDSGDRSFVTAHELAESDDKERERPSPGCPHDAAHPSGVCLDCYRERVRGGRK